jgi:hypothetical protein
VNIHLLSDIWNKSHSAYYFKNQVVVTFITALLFWIFTSLAIPSLTMNERGRNNEDAMNLYNFMAEKQLSIFIAGLILGIILARVIKSMYDKPIIVGIEIENDHFKIVTRRPTIDSIKEFTGSYTSLSIIKDTVKLSPLDSSHPSYKFYRDDDYLGVLVPEHFVWENYSKKRMTKSIKLFAAIIKKG